LFRRARLRPHCAGGCLRARLSAHGGSASLRYFAAASQNPSGEQDYSEIGMGSAIKHSSGRRYASLGSQNATAVLTDLSFRLRTIALADVFTDLFDTMAVQEAAWHAELAKTPPMIIPAVTRPLTRAERVFGVKMVQRIRSAANYIAA